MLSAQNINYTNGIFMFLIVGAVCSRLEPHPTPGFNKLYIMTIAILEAYRRRGIGNDPENN